MAFKKSVNTKKISKFLESNLSSKNKPIKKVTKIKSDIKKNSEKKSSAKKPSKKIDLPEVYPFSQIETTEDGKTIVKTVKPLTYSLMCWVKGTMGLPDTIDISDDSNHSEFQIDVPANDYEFSFKCYFDVVEEVGMIGLYIYHVDDDIVRKYWTKINKLILEKNLKMPFGQFQLVGDNKDRALRYFSSINVSGIASDDPNYHGDFKVSPKLFQNMFKDGLDSMNNSISDFLDVLSE